MKQIFPVGGMGAYLLALVMVLGGTVPGRGAEQSPEEAAQLVLNTARRAYNEQQYAVAAQQFREFLAKYGGHQDAVHARYGLGLALLEGPQKDYEGAIQALQPVVGVADFPDRGLALYSIGVAFRGMGRATQAQAEAKPAEAAALRNAAKQRFGQAEAQFGAAAEAFIAEAKKAAPAPPQPVAPQPAAPQPAAPQPAQPPAPEAPAAGAARLTYGEEVNGATLRVLPGTILRIELPHKFKPANYTTIKLTDDAKVIEDQGQDAEAAKTGVCRLRYRAAQVGTAYVIVTFSDTDPAKAGQAPGKTWQFAVRIKVRTDPPPEGLVTPTEPGILPVPPTPTPAPPAQPAQPAPPKAEPPKTPAPAKPAPAAPPKAPAQPTPPAPPPAQPAQPTPPKAEPPKAPAPAQPTPPAPTPAKPAPAAPPKAEPPKAPAPAQPTPPKAEPPKAPAPAQPTPPKAEPPKAPAPAQATPPAPPPAQPAQPTPAKPAPAAPPKAEPPKAPAPAQATPPPAPAAPPKAQAATSPAVRVASRHSALPWPVPTSTPMPAGVLAAAPAAALAVPNVAWEWAARARCDQCEMLLETEKYKEAADLAEALLADPAMGKSRYRALAMYHLGYARFSLREYQAAGRALSQLAPFEQAFGIHVRYLLARTHHLSEERPEAAIQYKAVQEGYEAKRTAAQEALKNPGALKPEERAALAALVNAPPPEYFLRARFYEAVLLAEGGQYAEALERLTALAQQFPRWPLGAEVRLRIGYCQLQMRNFPQAIQALQPLAEHPELADQALWWLARCHAGAADPVNAAAMEQALGRAIDLLQRGAEKSAALARSDPEAAVRRGDILMELGDTQQEAKQYNEAAATYQQVIGDKPSADRAEEAMQRRATALHLGGKYAESDALCKQFEQRYPESTLLPAVLFRSVENAYLVATAAADKPDEPKRPAELLRAFGPAMARYDRLLKKFPDFAYANLARQAMATAHYRLGRYADAVALMSAIPEPQRTGPLATVPYLLADCLIRTFPAETPDAVSAAGLLEQAEQAAGLLEGFTAAQPKSPEAPDALLKLGYCYQRIGGVLADAAEQQKRYAQAKQAYDRFIQQFGQHPSAATAVFERGKGWALLGNLNAAVGDWNRFQGGPATRAPVAPLAIMRLGTAMRALGRAPEAANVLGGFRSQQEAAILKDAARRDWVPMLQYEQALALKDAGKRAEALALFDGIVKQFAAHPAALNAAWRAGQCRREEAAEQLAAVREAATKPGATPEQTAAARKVIAEQTRALRQGAASLERLAGEIAKEGKGSDPHLRALYETAWCYRVLAEAEAEEAREKLEAKALARLEARAKRELAPGQEMPRLRRPDVPLSAVPVQASETAAEAQYEAVIAAKPGAALAVQARFELAEMLAGRGNHLRALELLSDAMGENPTAEMAEAIRLRMAASLLAVNKAAAAAAQIAKVRANPDSPMVREAWYLSGEAYFQQKNWPKAIQKLLPFRDQGPFQNVPDISDRALLRLGQAYAQAGQWEPSRGTFQMLVQRFPTSPLAQEARYGVGWALENQRAYDNAVRAYDEVTQRTAAEVAARAQLQMGVCRLAQKRYPEAAQALLVVPLAYDYPQWSGPALCEAARAYVAMNQPDEAVKLLKRVMKDLPESEWAKVAKQRLTEIK